MPNTKQPRHTTGLFGYSGQRATGMQKEFGQGKGILPLLAQMSSVDNPSFLLLAQALPQIVWTATPDGYQDYFNQQWFDYTGLTEEETYRGISALHSDDFPRYVQQWTNAIQSGEMYEAKYRFRRGSDGSYRWFLVRGLPVRDEEGTVVKWFGTFTDTHDQHMREETMRTMNEQLEEEVQRRIAQIAELRERDRNHLQRLSGVVEALPLAAMTCDEYSVVLHKNKKFRTLFKIDESEPSLIGRRFEEVLKTIQTKLQDEHAVEAIQGYAEQWTPILDRELFLKDGRVLSVDFIPLYEGGKYRGHLFLFRDVTQLKRTDAIKSEFVSLASHQLRTPLTTMRWALNMLQQKLNDTDKMLLGKAIAAAESMNTTITTLLSITKLQSGAVPIKFNRQNLCDILEDARKSMKAIFPNRKISLYCSQDIVIHTDANLLREALQIILSNALKYSPNETEVEMHAHKQGNDSIITITDHGYGIPEAEKSRIFEKFFRATNIQSKVPEGTGLGLFLCQQIIQVLGGAISFNSVQEKGTTFVIRLNK